MIGVGRFAIFRPDLDKKKRPGFGRLNLRIFMIC